jgi:hypothetical protein
MVHDTDLHPNVQAVRRTVVTRGKVVDQTAVPLGVEISR